MVKFKTYFKGVNLLREISQDKKLNKYQLAVEKFLRSFILENVNKRSIGIFAGSFKPPHKGHFAAAARAVNQNDIVYILISNGERDGFTAEKAKLIWEEYKKVLPNLEIRICKGSPIREAYELVDSLNQDPQAPVTTVSLYCDKDDMGRFSRMEQYATNLKGLKRIKTPRICSARDLRAALSAGDKATALTYFPRQLNGEALYQLAIS